MKQQVETYENSTARTPEQVDAFRATTDEKHREAKSRFSSMIGKGAVLLAAGAIGGNVAPAVFHATEYGAHTLVREIEHIGGAGLDAQANLDAGLRAADRANASHNINAEH